MNFIKKFLSDTKTGFFILFYALRDKETPLKTKFFILSALIYLISPLDIIPDLLFPLGILDDATIVPTILFFARRTIPDDTFAKIIAKAKQTNSFINKTFIAALFVAVATVFLFFILLYLLYKSIF